MPNTLLKDRSDMLAKARAFFAERNMIEVDCPILTSAASIDAHIDLIPATPNKTERRTLHSSPEYGMKRLLAGGSGDIYQLSHVFRDGELGKRHNPEFMLAEWYRCNFSFQQMIDETLAFVELFVGKQSHRSLTYREAFQHYANIDPFTTSESELITTLESHNITAHKSEKDDLLNILLATAIEPHLGQDKFVALTHYPASQAALAQTTEIDGVTVAERFEIYYKGYELANGYHELADPTEQRHRFEEANAQRLALGKEALPIDERFLEALHQLPDCCGVAVGFDRLMMLRHNKQEIADILPFGWESS